MRFTVALALVCTASCSEPKAGGESASSERDAAAPAHDAAMPSPIDVGGSRLSDLELPGDVVPLSRKPVPAARRRRARALNVEGLRHYERRDYKAAIDAYKRALRADPGHLLARYNLSCAYNLAGEPDKALALLAEFRADGCEACLARLERASEDADWHSMWDHPLFIEIVGVRAGNAEASEPFWKRGDAACPRGATLAGKAGAAIYCARGGARDGPFARWQGGKLVELGGYRRGERDGEWKLFYPGGALRSAGRYRAGKRHGPWSEWYESGVQQSDGRYSGGLRIGRWTWFDERGEIVKQATYERGKLVSQEITE